MSLGDVLLLLVVLWAGAMGLCVLSGVTQIIVDDLHQRAKRRRQGEQQDS